MKRPAVIETCFVAALLCATNLATPAFSQPIEKPEQLGPWIDAGDYRAVPIILARLREAERRSRKDDTDRYYLVGMIQHASMYQLDEAGPLMVELFDLAKKDSVELDAVAHAAAEYRSEAAMGLQRALAADPRLQSADLRAELYAALAESGDDKAADALADWMTAELARSAIDNTVTYSMISVVPAVRSKRFVDRINAIPLPPEAGPDETPKKASELKRARSDLLKLRARLALTNGTPETMIEFIGQATRDDVTSVDAAFTALARIGEPQHIAALEKLRLGKDRCLEQNDRLIARLGDTIAAIKRHHWQYFAEAAATQPTNR